MVCANILKPKQLAITHQDSFNYPRTQMSLVTIDVRVIFAVSNWWVLSAEPMNGSPRLLTSSIISIHLCDLGNRMAESRCPVTA